MKADVTNWNKFPVVNSEVINSNGKTDLEWAGQHNTSLISRGLGRSYGDSSLYSAISDNTFNNHLLQFDDQNGVLECESGTSFDKILSVFIPKGWFLPVTPGTKYITMGGGIAADVHGKNHHIEGSIKQFILSFTILCDDGTVYTCSPTENKDLFDATFGGLGLTGIILTAKIQMKPIESSYIKYNYIKARNLEEIFKLFEDNTKATYSVAWIDCLKQGKNFGRSILMLGEHATKSDLTDKYSKRILQPHNSQQKLSVPFNFPSFILNPFSVKSFNFLYYNKQFKRIKEGLVHYDPYFYPLDSILDWNKIYGKKGFIQYQFVLPHETSYKGLTEILNQISHYNAGSFLAVLKLFGKGNPYLSFPHPGYTLALDFPMTKNLFKILSKLDQIVNDHGGRVYLIKDARLSPEMVTSGYPELESFKTIVKKYNPNGLFKSNLSERLGIT